MIDIKRLVWAKSNIYWDASMNSGTGGLRFSESTVYNYQGVFFKWGSLVGISPVGGTPGNSADGVVLYIPNVSDGTWQESTIGTAHGLWPNSGTYESIPSYDYNGVGLPGSNLYPRIPAYNYYVGDICSYITNAVWRMPTSTELTTTNYSNWVNGSTSNLNAEGMGTITYGRTYNSAGVFLPASGMRHTHLYFTNNTMGGVLEVGITGVYWTGTYSLYPLNAVFDNTGVWITQARTGNAFSIRCVK
jgi:hypothetical protein